MNVENLELLARLNNRRHKGIFFISIGLNNILQGLKSTGPDWRISTA
jgi:hypothetical protein